MKPHPEVHIATDQISFFCRLLADGVLVAATAGASVYAFLADQIGVPPEYIRNRIQTIFLDGKAVDDVENTVITENATLALSAAMPGLVGATFRKSGYYSTLRKAISHEQQADASHRQQITFTLKLFNAIARELGPGLFAKGVRINGFAFQDFIQYQEERFNNACRMITMNGKELEARALLSNQWRTALVHLFVTESSKRNVDGAE